MSGNLEKNRHFEGISYLSVIASFGVLGWFCAGWFLNERNPSYFFQTIILVECFIVAGLFFWNLYSLILSFALKHDFREIKKADSWTYSVFLLLLVYPQLSGIAEVFPPGWFKIIFFATVGVVFFLVKFLQLVYRLWGVLIAAAFFFSVVLGASVTEIRTAPQTVFDAFSLKVIIGAQLGALALAGGCFAVFRRRVVEIVLSLIVVFFSALGWYYTTSPSSSPPLPSRDDIEMLPSAMGKWLFSSSPKVRNVRITVDDETRDVVYFLSPAGVSEKVVLSRNAYLTFGVAVSYFSEEATGAGVKVSFSAGEGDEPFWSTFLDPVHDRRDRHWKDFVVDLSRFGEGEIELSLKVEGAPHVAISSPQIFSRYAEGKNNFPNIVFILIDTLRADRVGFGGCAEAVTPELDSLAQSGVVFERALSMAPWTEPATAAIFTGMPPSQLGVGFPDVTLPKSAKTLAEYLLDVGYSTAAFSGNPLISAQFSFDKGFAVFNEKCVGHFQWRSAECLTDEVINWFKKKPPRPFFLYVHYIDPHARYDAPPPYHDRFSYGYTGDNESVERGDIVPFEMRIKRGQKLELSAEDAEYLEKLYLGEIAYVDEQVGRLVEFIKSCSESPTLFIITSDHGEEFMEHGIVGHIYNLHDTLLHVPLIFFGDGIKKGAKVKTPVSTADITPTLLDMLGIPSPQNSWGSSFKPLLEGGTVEERPIFAERADFWRNSYAVIADGWKLIYSPHDNITMLFDITNDAGEYRNLSGKNKTVEKAMMQKLHEFLNWIESHKLPPTAPDYERRREHKRRLKALGYIGN